MSTDDRPVVVSLTDPAASERARSGTKAATLARLARAGLPVPEGLIVLPEAGRDWEAARAALAAGIAGMRRGLFAVRSSALAEDLEGASFAGQYETELNVPADEVPAAVRRVVASEANERVRAYRRARAESVDETSGLAVIVQRMVDAERAGVAFTADPLTGDRAEVVVSAVRGLGDRLVSGEAVPDEWRVRGDHAKRGPGSENVIDAAQARAIAALARRVEHEFGVPQDIEWAEAQGALYLLQARPMTALSDVDWNPPFKGWWLRNLRLGELLPEPVTPLFADWLLPLLDSGHARATREDMGIAVEPASAVINGWYYTTAQGRGSPAGMLLRLIRRPRALMRLFTLLVQTQRDPRKADALLTRLAERWRDDRQPRYDRKVAEAEPRVDAMSREELAATVDEVGVLAGELGWSVESVAGSAWKIEGAFNRFVRRYIAGALAGSYQRMIIGLPGTEPDLAAHAVYSLDPYWPTAGEHVAASLDPAVLARHRRLREEGELVVAACRAALAGDPVKLRRFDELLALARRYAVLREQQTRAFTRGWPLLRRAVLRLGAMSARGGAIEKADDVFFLTHAELTVADGARDLRTAVAERRSRWDAQRRLVPPLEIGAPPAIARGAISGMVESARAASRQPDGAIVGHPASPGRASGPVRIVSGPEQFDAFERGDVLVARTTAPAWTPLFSRAAAVVTDGGSLAAHASLVAREFGIPAVVATGDATRRLRDGQIVTVDGSAGWVEVGGDRWGADRP